MGWLDLAISVVVIWIAIDVVVVAALISAAGRRPRARPARPLESRRLRLVSSRPGSARTRA